MTTTATTAGELFLFGGIVDGQVSGDLHVFSTQDFSTTLLRTRGDIPAPRYGHSTTLLDPTALLIYGGTTIFNALNDDSLYILNIESREWRRVVANVPGPNGRTHHTTTMVGSKIFLFGGYLENHLNDMWSLELNSPDPLWELYEPAPGSEKPVRRSRHVSVTTEGRIIIFGGSAGEFYYNDTWSFDVSTRKWTELQCTGPIPCPREGHAAVLVDDVMYVFGGTTGKICLDDLSALQLSTQRWFKFHNERSSPLRRSYHAMGSNGTRVFVVGGNSPDAHEDDISLIHVFDTKHFKYPDPEPNAVNPNVKATHLARTSSAGPSNYPTYFSSEAHGASPLQNATPVLARPAFSQITHERNPKDDISEGSTEYHAKFEAPHSTSEGEATRLELEWLLSESLAERDQRIERLLSESLAERDRRIARLTDELAALKSALLEQAETKAVEAARRLEQELRGHADDRRLKRTSLVKQIQRDAELVDMQSRLGDMQASLDALNELLLSRD